jgi:hypothetical protein
VICRIDGREAVAIQEPRLTAIENRLSGVETRLAVMNWMVAGLYAVLTLGGMPSLWLLLRIAFKVGALTL